MMRPGYTARESITRVAWLPSAGFDYRKATLHTFVRHEEVPAEELKHANGPRSMRPGLAMIFVCTESGAERVWGME